MSRIVRLEIERLAPTGEGVARLSGKAVFVEGSLPGERVEAEVFAERSRFARARTLSVERASPDRRPTGAHSDRCGGTDWAHFDPAAARAAKRSLFLETMARIGGVAAADFGPLPISESPLEYRLRNQFHLQGRVAGFFERHSHRIVPIDGCEIVSAPAREVLGELARNNDAADDLVETIETVETVETGPGYRIALWNRTREVPVGPNRAVEIRSAPASFSVSPRAFFQVNRFLFPRLFEEVRDRARALGGATALDAYSGVGFFTRALVRRRLSRDRGRRLRRIRRARAREPASACRPGSVQDRRIERRVLSRTVVRIVRSRSRRSARARGFRISPAKSRAARGPRSSTCRATRPRSRATCGRSSRSASRWSRRSSRISSP